MVDHFVPWFSTGKLQIIETAYVFNYENNTKIVENLNAIFKWLENEQKLKKKKKMYSVPVLPWK